MNLGDVSNYRDEHYTVLRLHTWSYTKVITSLHTNCESQLSRTHLRSSACHLPPSGRPGQLLLLHAVWLMEQDSQWYCFWQRELIGQVLKVLPPIFSLWNTVYKCTNLWVCDSIDRNLRTRRFKICKCVHSRIFMVINGTFIILKINDPCQFDKMCSSVKSQVCDSCYIYSHIKRAKLRLQICKS